MCSPPVSVWFPLVNQIMIPRGSLYHTYSHPSTHEPALSRSTALLRMAVRSLMAQEKNMSASQPHSFLLRSLYHDSHLRCLPLLTQLSWSPFAVCHKSASSFLAHLRSLYHIFLYSSSAISSVVFTEYLFTDVCPSNGILPMLRISNRKNLQPEL